MSETQDTSLTLGACFSSVGRGLERALKKVGMAPDVPTDDVSRHSVARAVSSVIADQRHLRLDQLLPGLDRVPHSKLPLIDLSIRGQNILKNAGIRTVGALAEKTIEELWKLRNCGAKTVDEICSMAVEIHLDHFKPEFDQESSGTQPAKASRLADASGAKTRPQPRRTEVVLAQLGDSLGVVASWAAETQEGKALGDFLSLREGVGPLPDDVQDAQSAFLSTRLTALISQPSDEWVGVLHRFFQELEPREREVFEERELRKNGRTLNELGEEFGVTRERIRQVQKRIARKIRRALADPKLAPFGWRLFELSSTLRNGAPEWSSLLRSALVKALRSLDQSIVNPEFLLWAAGPYRIRNGWWLREEASFPTISQDSDLFTSGLTISEEAVSEWLESNGFDARWAAAVLEESKATRQFGDRWFRWAGYAADKAEVILTVLGKPTDSDQIVERIGEDYNSVSIRNRLFEDDRFVRVNKREFALASWGLEEYSGITQEIRERIEREGGSVALSAVTEELAKTFDVAESSVKAYAEAPMFVVEGGRVRLRGQDEQYSVDDRIELVPGLFPDPDAKEVHLLHRVTKESMRGSGTSIKEPVAAALGCSPGAQASFAVGSDESLAVTWPRASATGPSLGSVRALTDLTRAKKGEEIRITFDLGNGTATASRVEARETDLGALTGLTLEEGNELGTLATSLNCSRSAVRGILRERGDGRVADVLPDEAPDPKLDKALESLGALLDRD